MSASPVVVVGGGHAGGAFVGLLRQTGYDGDVVLVCHEDDAPYHRPPLSKKFVGDELEQPLRDAEFYEEQRIDLRLGTEVTGVDPEAREVTFADGSTLAYGTLVLATGAAPRELSIPGADLDGVTTLRTLADARVLRDSFSARHRLAIVGGGYVGLEVAAVARSNDIEATVVEREDRVLARVASPELSEILTRHHRDQGTEVLTGADVASFAGDDAGRVRAVVLADGTEIPCDLALVGVGAIPREDLARAAGVACDGGVLVDERTRTNVDGILAIGDLTRRPMVVGAADPVSMRMESIPSATEQAKQAAALIAERDAPKGEVPWFWSDQFDLKLKIAGLVRPSESTVVRGDPASGKFAVFHVDGDVIVAVESANASSDFMAGKKFIGQSQRVDVGRLGDPSVKLRDAVVS